MFLGAKNMVELSTVINPVLFSIASNTDFSAISRILRARIFIPTGEIENSLPASQP